MKFLKFVFIFATIGTMILLTGCGHSAEEDKQRIVNWLNDTYGENAYTMEQNPKNKRYFIVVLHEYPELKFNTTVVRDVKRGTSYLWSDVDEVFCESAIQQFTKSNTISPDTLSYDEDIQYVYSTEASSLEELKTSYDKMISFITFVSEHYPIIVDTGALDMRMDVGGIRLKGRDDSDKWIYLDIAEAKDKKLNIKPYEEIYHELKPMLMTHPENPKGLLFHADVGRSFLLGSDTFDDCLYKNLVLDNAENNTPEKLRKIILQPGELSEPYTFESESDYEFTTVTVQAKNLTKSPSSLLDATIVKAEIHPQTGTGIHISSTWIELEEDPRRGEWVDPYKVLGISPPKTEQEKKEGVPYKNAKVLFTMSESYNSVKEVTLTFQE